MTIDRKILRDKKKKSDKDFHLDPYPIAVTRCSLSYSNHSQSNLDFFTLFEILMSKHSIDVYVIPLISSTFCLIELTQLANERLIFPLNSCFPGA